MLCHEILILRVLEEQVVDVRLIERAPSVCREAERSGAERRACLCRSGAVGLQRADGGASAGAWGCVGGQRGMHGRVVRWRRPQGTGSPWG